ncbi:MAG: hypothetical protein ACYDD6_00975 [Acidimicrobiales bacterium]
MRIDSGAHDDPVVQVFAIVLDEVRRALRAPERDQLSANACRSVANAADLFGPRLAEKFGGKTAFADEKGPNYENPGEMPGMYL